MAEVTVRSQYDLAGPALHSMALAMGGGGRTFTDNVTAKAGGAQGTATLITTCYTRVVTVGSANDSVQLPPALGGQERTIANAHASNAIQIFGNSSLTDTINGTAGATGISLAAGKTIRLFSFVGAWVGVLSA